MKGRGGSRAGATPDLPLEPPASAVAADAPPEEAPRRPRYPLVYESYSDNEWSIRSNAAAFSRPLAVAGQVRVRRFRITVELLDEPVDVIQGRIRALWRESTNHKMRVELTECAAEYGMVLDPQEWGIDAKE